MWHDRSAKIKKSDKETEEKRLPQPRKTSWRRKCHRGTTGGSTGAIAVPLKGFHYYLKNKIPNTRRNIFLFWTHLKVAIDPARRRISPGKRGYRQNFWQYKWTCSTVKSPPMCCRMFTWNDIAVVLVQEPYVYGGETSNQCIWAILLYRLWITKSRCSI